MTSSVNRIAAVWSEPDRVVHLLVDGVALVDTIAPGREPWSNSAPKAAESPFSHKHVETFARQWLAGYRDASVRANDELEPGELELSVCSFCADLQCGSFAVWMRREGSVVLWERPHWAINMTRWRDELEPGDDPEECKEAHSPADDLDPVGWFPATLTFDAAEYDAAMEEVEGLMLAHPWPEHPIEPPSVWKRWFKRR
ncbi:hypothetical protein DWB68_00565 [Galactobacter valiniphilus]|uniref:Uncharacterized protein n=2 Tax=Galactobacter valiniphilus TaxID=2676122 RepID=A0A399JFK0_9MICC|nr:hypothetical protein DWB68_00565 [Galactobacter valiniphilus]